MQQSEGQKWRAFACFKELSRYLFRKAGADPPLGIIVAVGKKQSAEALMHSGRCARCSLGRAFISGLLVETDRVFVSKPHAIISYVTRRDIAETVRFILEAENPSD